MCVWEGGRELAEIVMTLCYCRRTTEVQLYKIKKLFIYIMINYILSSYKNYRAGLNKGIALMNGVGCGYGVKLG